MDKRSRGRVVVAVVFLAISIGLFAFYLALQEVPVVFKESLEVGNSSGPPLKTFVCEYDGEEGDYEKGDVFLVLTSEDKSNYNQGDKLYLYFIGKPHLSDDGYSVKPIPISKRK